MRNILSFSPVTRPYSYWIDFLRAAAAVIVLVAHYNHFGLSDPSTQPFYDVLYYVYRDGGSLAVWLFWVISGFVFAQVYLAKQGTTRDFFVNRFARLYPLHVLTLGMVAVLQWVSLRETGTYLIYEFNDWYHFFLNLLFIPAWGFEVGRSFNGPVWSVSVEILIYIIFWFSLTFILRRGLITTLGLSALFINLYFADVPGSSFWLCGFFFYLGVSTFILNSAWYDRIDYRLWWTIGLGSVALLLSIWSQPSVILLMALWCPAILFLFSLFDSVDVHGWGVKTRGFGNLSYGMYLLHIPVQLVFLLVMLQFGWSNDIARSPWFLLLFIVTVGAVSFVSYRYFESPLRKYIREKSAR
jgi:peptidoglycan/LPS O-acetylase OafA/YrhL